MSREKELTKLFNKLKLSEVFSTYALTLDMLSEFEESKDTNHEYFDKLLSMQDMLQIEIYIRMDL